MDLPRHDLEMVCPHQMWWSSMKQHYF